MSFMEFFLDKYALDSVWCDDKGDESVFDKVMEG